MKVLRKLWNKSKRLKESFPNFLSTAKAKGEPLYLFDLDRTLLLTNSSYLFGRFLFQKGTISLFQLFPVLFAYSLYNGGILSIKTLHRMCFSSLFQFAPKKQIETLAEEFVSKLADTEINPLLQEYLADVRKGKVRGVILSASPYFLVEAIAKKLGIERIYSTHYATNEEGEFTFVSSVLSSKEKEKIVKSLREEFPQTHFTGFGDCIEDYAFLRLCDKAIAVQPTTRLAKLAQKAGWTILRKAP